MVLEVKGIIPAIVTPLEKDESIDHEGLREVVNYLIDGGVHGIFCCGSQGEIYALNDDERMEVIKTTIDETNGRVPVYAGTGEVTTEKVIKLTKYAKDAGADAASIATPYFIKPSKDELYRHYGRIAEAVDIPIVLYNNPERTGVNLEPPLVSKLADIENVLGIKDSSGDLTLTADYIRVTPKDFSIIAGRDSLILATLIYGGKAAIAATANVAPKLVVEIYESFIKGDLERARQAQFKLLPLRLAFSLGTFPAVIKEAMTMIGKPSGPTRSPVGSISEENRKELRSVLKDLGLA
ncbi:4-hydroxy-tetrahydrodipicolinate synthase [Candidatus Bathyarchaeota archaeon]|nr:4-hydroxy-tetrahydrodipicolinate synthase [Candidatus Bathyarchaeota archaeon]